MKVNLVGQSMGLALVLTLVGTAATQATDLQRLTFTIHATFFSSETKQSKPVDPHVFVQDPASPGATGPQNIQHRRLSPGPHRARRQDHAALQRQG